MTSILCRLSTSGSIHRKCHMPVWISQCSSNSKHAFSPFPVQKYFPWRDLLQLHQRAQWQQSSGQRYSCKGNGSCEVIEYLLQLWQLFCLTAIPWFSPLTGGPADELPEVKFICFKLCGFRAQARVLHWWCYPSRGQGDWDTHVCHLMV